MGILQKILTKSRFPKILIKIEIFRENLHQNWGCQDFDQNRYFFQLLAKIQIFKKFGFQSRFFFLNDQSRDFGYLDRNRDVSNKVEVPWKIITKLEIFANLTKSPFSKILSKIDIFEILTKIEVFEKSSAKRDF